MIASDAAVPFKDPQVGLAWCLSNDVDLVIVDYVMPKINGLQFIEAFLSDPSRADIPVIMVTTSDTTEVRYNALQLGATDFLRKPVDKIEFLTRVRNLLTLSRHHKQTKIQAVLLAEEVRKATSAIIEREREAILVLSRAAEFRDNETGAHLLRMSSYCQIIATRLELPPEEVELVFTAAPMHDIGKIGIPDQVLLKPGPLTPEERDIMTTHAVIGWQILCNNQSPLLQMAAKIAVSHHEKWDGTGYPNRLSGLDIPLAGRITAVADVFDALTSVRPYKQAWPLDKALDFLRSNRGTHFDPACVDAFLASLDQVAAVVDRYGRN
ncbi:Two-component response transcriptional regulator rpfG [Magnetospirillum molischianum DSM 120]|uniref:Two-component response transcriptional regulator rpfG n=2 Tax=Magnetospirillum molischianum TaxID=1083 RepID=H8FQN3_MAGML|nr:Two-component response transcriptional regulator rpfG [Magnetospirillum molischianum DSM 120]